MEFLTENRLTAPSNNLINNLSMKNRNALKKYADTGRSKQHSKDCSNNYRMTFNSTKHKISQFEYIIKYLLDIWNSSAGIK